MIEVSKQTFGLVRISPSKYVNSYSSTNPGKLITFEATMEASAKQSPEEWTFEVRTVLHSFFHSSLFGASLFSKKAEKFSRKKDGDALKISSDCYFGGLVCYRCARLLAHSDSIRTKQKCHCCQNVTIAESIYYLTCSLGPAKSVTIVRMSL